MDVDGEVQALVDVIRTKYGGSVKFGVLVRDEEVCDRFEALNGTLRAGKKRGALTFLGEMLLQGAHDDVDVALVGG
jgi:hypothetical protein